MPARRIVAAATALVALSVACGSEAAPEAAGSPTARPAAPSATPPGAEQPVVAEVLDFEAPLLGGGTLRGETLAGRDVAFWFWAPW